MGDLVLGAEGSNLSTGEFIPLSDMLVCRKLKRNEVLQHEFNHLLSCDFRERYSFDPLGEIVSYDQ